MSLNLKKNLVEEFNQRIYKSTIKTKKYPCLCGGAEIRKLWSWDRFGFWNPVGICKQCGLIQINPRLTEEEYGKFYSSDDYRLLYGGDEYLEEAETRYGRKVSEEIFEHLRPIMEERGLKTVVEVGCGGGWHLMPFANRGYEVTGFDYSPSMVELGRSKGLNLEVKSAKELEGLDKKFDVIILNHVVEHFSDFFKSMESVTRLLNNGGVIYVGVPDMERYFDIRQLQNAHILYFTPRTFKYYMDVCGLNNITWGPHQTHMYGVFDIGGNKLGLDFLKNEYGQMMKKYRSGRFRYLAIRILEITGLKEIIKRMVPGLRPTFQKPEDI